MELVTPGIGLIIWMTLAFAVLVWILAKFAWKPIMHALREREESIEDALHQADTVRQEIKTMQSRHEELLAQAKDERDVILKKARELKESIIEEARNRANQEYNRIVESAKETIHFEKMAAITELKNQIAQLSIEIAEKILKKELAGKEDQHKLIQKYVDEISFN